jgi:hypothetical protein
MIEDYITTRVDDKLRNDKTTLLEKVNYVMAEKEKSILKQIGRIP